MGEHKKYGGKSHPHKPKKGKGSYTRKPKKSKKKVDSNSKIVYSSLHILI